MTGTFAIIGILIATIMGANKEFGKIESKKINYTHIGLMVFTVFITSISLNVLFSLLLNFEGTIESMNVQTSFLSPLMNTILWISTTILNVIVLFLILSIARRSDIGRRTLIMAIPLLFILTLVRGISEILAKSTVDTALPLAIGLTVLVVSISYIPVFFFYKSNNIQKAIFTK